MTFTIQGTLPNLNDYIKACRANKYAGAEMKNKTEHLVILHARKLPTYKKPVFVKFHWIEPNRNRDKDNIAFAKKFIFDGLVKAGKLKGDGWKFVEGFSDTFGVDKANPRIEIEIREVKEV